MTATRVWGELARHLRPEDIASASARSFESDDPIDQEDDPPGTIDRLVAGEAAIEGITETLQEIQEIIVFAGEVSSELAPRMNTSTSFATRLTLMHQWADRLREPNTRLDEASDRYAQQVNEIDTMVRIIVDRVKSGEEGLGEVREGLGNFAELSDLVEEANVGITGMVHSVRGLRSLSTVMRETTKAMERSLNRVLSADGVIGSWRQIIEELPGWTDGSGQ